MEETNVCATCGESVATADELVEHNTAKHAKAPEEVVAEESAPAADAAPEAEMPAEPATEAQAEEAAA